ncbi:efflux RND transporter periplasmic adaptor subunit [Sphingomonas koreensis]|jgi:Cu(I)/Ag(I) efflux system membrane fusion protein|uniref:Efflux RND transporter periplasmic adaptor subunit n=1 Tax=Sphingomonas koreensis TaxID=93064 RepID=A0A1L6JFD0_9SPHN|nr:MULTISPECIES: efflux RND transporter periplasmic adaptor subunit [Sphingomonas]APR54634.1 efflux transporter periplasmic adaptor subunit [Sphingomonas koreensis]MBA4760934.1 efflux RND transporter periplasmic adaptor subunit [Sphingomonas sp.]MDC7810827.1 efflux RND transporter periplasmic adaptor subunit [Sphingomonas koreensis]MDK2769288.1 efflux RND transporter periplasmic adaptor subunit [Sphingomonas sp.]PJI89700.1 Cu(I)/Ag(I) efflux system membrane fusion protein [Sphingomonas koreens
MTIQLSHRARLGLAGAVLALAAGAAGYGIAQFGRTDAPPQQAGQDGRKILYWYDPMVPSQHFDKPGKSPFMDMQLVPKYADEGAQGAPGMAIDPARVQSLGLRVATAERGALASGLTATGTIDFNQRDVAIVQARAAGFVQRVYARAPGDVIGAGAPLADLLIPEWAGAQAEYLAVRRTGNPALAQAARQRLALLGMPPGTIAAVERGGRPHNVITIATPAGGTIKTLGVRQGMTVTAGQTLAEVNGLATVWLNAAVPEALAGQLRPGQSATATLSAWPGERFTGRVAAILPDIQAESRTLTVRIELPNRGGRLRPGMFASVDFGGASRSALLVPSEAVIRTGKRTLVMLALAGGRYQPAEVQAGSEAGGKTEILAGLSDGEKIVASGQFLLDSEASLSSVPARPIGGSARPPAAQPALYEAVGRIGKIDASGVTLDHGPVPALRWPAMTMTFRLGSPALARGFKVGDRVRFGFDQPPEGPTLRRMTREAGQ